jgi:hypothetical protein
VSVIRSGLASSTYRGPTGIVGVVQGACREAGIRSIGMWAPTPPYLAGNPFPKAVLTIVEKIADITNLHIDTIELITVDAEYTQKVDEAIENSGAELEEYLEEMESYDEPRTRASMRSSGAWRVTHRRDHVRDRQVDPSACRSCVDRRTHRPGIPRDRHSQSDR